MTIATLSQAIPNSVPALGGRAGGRVQTPPPSRCLLDNGPETLINVLLAECGRNNVVAGRIRRTRNGRVQFVFDLQCGAAYPHARPDVRAAADWMRAHRVLDRPTFFDACPCAGRSADVHSKALKMLAEDDKVIEKDHGVWVWKE